MDWGEHDDDSDDLDAGLAVAVRGAGALAAASMHGWLILILRLMCIFFRRR